MAAVLIADRMTGSWRAMTAGGTISAGGKGERDMLRVIRNEMESEEVSTYLFL
jgi:Iap family predicted aminopeptidase